MTTQPPTDDERIDAARQAQQDRWTWPNTTTWTDVARAVARLDSAAIAAGHPASWGKLHLVIPPDDRAIARISRPGSGDRIPGGMMLANTPSASLDILTTRLAIYDDLAVAIQDSATLYTINRSTR